MAWTQSDIDALKKAMAGGFRRVRYTSGEVEYRSLEEMKRLLADMEQSVSATKRIRRTVGNFRSGF